LDHANKFSNVSGNTECKMSPLSSTQVFLSLIHQGITVVLLSMLTSFSYSLEIVISFSESWTRTIDFSHSVDTTCCLSVSTLELAVWKPANQTLFKSDLFITQSSLPMQLTKPYHHLPLHQSLNSLHSLLTCVSSNFIH